MYYTYIYFFLSETTGLSGVPLLTTLTLPLPFKVLSAIWDFFHLLLIGQPVKGCVTIEHYLNLFPYSFWWLCSTSCYLSKTSIRVRVNSDGLDFVLFKTALSPLGQLKTVLHTMLQYHTVSPQWLHYCITFYTGIGLGTHKLALHDTIFSLWSGIEIGHLRTHNVMADLLAPRLKTVNEKISIKISVCETTGKTVI